MSEKVSEGIAKACIGLQVWKKSKKPFKSGNKVNTVSGVTVNPHTNKTAFTFKEDDSTVDAWICQLTNPNEN